MSMFGTRIAAIGMALLLAATAVAAPPAASPTFTIAVIPDTQNYVDYRAQRAEGFPFDAREMFLDQMAYVARHLRANGGTIDFVTALGDVWQHLPSDVPDPEHAALGLKSVPSLVLAQAASPRFRDKIRSVEIPTALEGYRMIAGKVPFALVPGNHDYDALWTDARYPPDPAAKIGAGRPSGLGILHLGGLDLWRGAFGDATPFFRNKPWYVSSFRHGADSAVVFTAGGRRFLHFGFEMQPDDAALDWARKVLARYPGVPTIVTIHQYLKPDGTRGADAMIRLSLVQPAHNDPEALWTKFIAANDQIFLVLNGHEEGAARRVDLNAAGHEVHQLLSDYQGRRQTFRDVAPGDTRTFPGIGDGWLRLMDFDLTPGQEHVHVRTYSTVYKAEARDLPDYAHWYKPGEHPDMTDREFLDQDDFTIALKDFDRRFPRTER
jgi:hypothetical protein